MADATSRILNLMKKTNTNVVSNYVSLTVKSTNPLQLALSDRIILDEKFVKFSDHINKSLISVGDKFNAISLDDEQTYYVTDVISSINYLPKYQGKLIAGTGITITDDNVISSTGGGGTSNYNNLTNKPQINGNTLSGNKSSSDLGLQSQITSSNKLSADLVDDTSSTNKFVSGTDKTNWNAAYDHSQLTSGNPHNVTKSDVGLGNVGNFKAVSTEANQGLTSTEKSNARANIGAGTSNLTLGTTSSTAYRGDYGDTAYTHATDSSRLTTAQTSGFYKIGTTAEGHVASVSAVEQSDISNLGFTPTVMQSKTYTDFIGSSTGNNFTYNGFTFGSIRPTSFTEQWSIRYRIKVWVPADSNYSAISDVYLIGTQSVNNAYAYFNNINSTSYRPVYYHDLVPLKEAGYTNGYGHTLGFSLADSTNRASADYKRSATIEILNCVNCTFTFFDDLYLGYTYPGQGSTNFADILQRNWSSSGLQESGDADTVDVVKATYERALVGTNGIYGYNILTYDTDNKLQGFVTSYSNGTSKTKNSATFRLGMPFFYYNSSTNKVANELPADGTLRLDQPGMNLRYSTNCGTTLELNKPVYLVGIPSGSTFTLADTWWTQTLPTTNDGKIYILLGVSYSNYQIQWNMHHPIYWYKDGALQEYQIPINSSDVTTALGYTPQHELTAGTNISISNNTISATDTTYSAGTNISISNENVISTSAQVNVLEGVQVDGTDLTITNKKVNITGKENTSNKVTSLSGSSTDDQYPSAKVVYTELGNKLNTSLKGANNGLAELDANGKVPTAQLPSYVDDVLEYSSTSAFPATGETGKIYVALDTNKTYRWSGSEYVEISASLALGETSSTAYRGDRGKTAYDHATDSSRLTTAKTSGLYKIATTSEGHIASATEVEKADITALGIPGSVPTKTSDLTNDSNFIDNTGSTSGNAGTATKLQTSRTIAIGTGATGTATSFDGSANITIPITEMKDAYLTWGGKEITDNVTPSDAGCIDEFGHNKLAYLPASCIDIAYSIDGGTTWVDYGVSDANKVKMVTTSFGGVSSGGSTTATEENVTNLKLRIRIACGTVDGHAKIYTAAKKILFNVTDPGANATLNIRYRSIANYMNDVDTWSTVSTTYNVRGGSGWNSIPFSYKFGGSMTTQTSQIGQFEFVFSNTKLGTWGAKKVSVLDIRLIGVTNWTTPSTMAKYGRIYDIDENQNATFPANLTISASSGLNYTGIENAASDTSRNVWFSHSSKKGTPCYNDKFKYNPSTDILTVGSISGTAAKATGDKNGNDITTTYYPVTNPSGYTANEGTITGVSIDGTSVATSGVANITSIPTSVLAPIMTKTYTGVQGSGDNDTAHYGFYYMSVKPTTFTEPWSIRYRIHVWVPGQTNFDAISESFFVGDQANVNAYACFNHFYSTSYRPVYYQNIYRLTQTGFTNGYGHAVAMDMTSSNERATDGYARSFTVEILALQNCTVEFLDTPVLWANWTGGNSTNYTGVTQYNFYSNGLMETGDNDTNTIAYIIKSYYERLKAGTNKVYGYNLCMTTSNDTLEGFVNSSSTGTTKTKNTSSFRLGSSIFYLNSATEIAAGGVAGDNTLLLQNNLVDLRYSTNCAKTLTANKPVYLVGTPSGAYFTLDTTWWTQTLPSTADGKIYILLGTAYDTYRIAFNIDHPIYEYKNGALRLYQVPEATFTGTDGTNAGTSGLVPAPATTDAGKYLKADGTWDTPSGGGGTSDYTNLTNKPSINSVTLSGNKTTTDLFTAGSNIQFNGGTISATDTTYESKTAASGGTDISLVTTGEKYTWNNKGTYSKPSGGIPKTDLASAVQTSLGLADTALQSSAITNMEVTTNKVTSISSSSTDTQYPSAKLLYDQLALKQGTLTAGSNITIDANNEISATDTTYSNFTGTDGTAAGTSGLVPAPATADTGKFLKADGTWAVASAGSSDYTDLTNKPQINGITLTGDQTASDLGIKIKNIDTLNLVDGAAMPSELDFESGKPKLYLITTLQKNGTEVNAKLNQSLWLGYKQLSSNDYYLQFIQGKNNIGSGRYDGYRFYTYYNPANAENPYCSWTLEYDHHITYSTTDLTAGTSALATGSLYFVYE